MAIDLSVLMIIAGLLAIAAPLLAGIAVTFVVGWMLALSGILHLVFAWRGGSARAIATPGEGLSSLTLVIAAYLFAEGILEGVMSFRLWQRGAGWLLVDGLITLVLAVMIWSTWPSSAAWAVATLLGIGMFFSGATRLMSLLALRRIAAPA